MQITKALYESFSVSILYLPSNTFRAFLVTLRTLKQTNKQTNRSHAVQRPSYRNTTIHIPQRASYSLFIRALHIQASASRSPGEERRREPGEAHRLNPQGNPQGPANEPTPIIPSTQGPEQFPHGSEFHCRIARRHCDIQCGENEVNDGVDGRCG